MISSGDPLLQFDYGSLEIRVVGHIGGTTRPLGMFSAAEEEAILESVRSVRKLVMKACLIVRRASGLCVSADAFGYCDHKERALSHLVGANQILRITPTPWVTLNQLDMLDAQLPVFEEYESVRVFYQDTLEQRRALVVGLRLIICD